MNILLKLKKRERVTRKYQLIICVLLVWILLSTVKPSYGQSLWSVPVALSPEGFFSWFPDIIADPYGNVHAVWASGNSGFDEVFYSSTNNGYEWSKPNDIFATPVIGNESYATRPSLLLDKNGRINLSFVDAQAIYFSKSIIEKASSPQDWSSRLSMTGSQSGYYSRMALDSQNTLHFIYTQNYPTATCPICYHIFYRQSVDGGNKWSNSVDLITDENGAVKPQILIDKNDNIHLVWESGKGGGTGQLSDPTAVSYAASYDKGKTWSIPVKLSGSGDEMGKNIAIGADKSGNLVVAWWSLPADTIKYQISKDNGKSWTKADSIPGVWGAAAVYASKLDDYAFANDSDGNLHLAAVGRLSANQESLNILNLVWDGSKWEKPDIIATYKGDVPEWPRIAVSQGNQLFVIWFVRDLAHIWAQENAHYRVFFSRGYAPSQSVGNEPLPTPESSGSTSPTNQSKSTPIIPSSVPALGTGLPTISNNVQKQQVSIPTSEAGLLPLLLAAIIPSILLIIGIAVYKYIQSR